MSLYFEFNSQLQTDLKNIYMNLNKDNAIKLVFDNTKQATKSGTHIISVDGNIVKHDYKFSYSKNNNIYFLFDENFICQYVGKKGNEKGINYRLGLHLVKNETTIGSSIDKICHYLNNINNRERAIYVITFRIEPSYMAEGVESYFIDYFRSKNGAKWLKRK
ncbi:hypothetical protein [Terrisporobacter hibernicus]|uniref:GIY-YIG domain-containing protein n=1 Tax=Terrisporobacter hibernicus TaxID=2813371 RepID=A0AAX2ZHJ2_9FIRM|nr:hypothetical protein [Terrisporobacter hibernicus]UEL48296.1 hypothetical protein JW646_02250 [Terrisporobacter hibernicus]